jgi:hypothetical protein
LYNFILAAISNPPLFGSFFYYKDKTWQKKTGAGQKAYPGTAIIVKIPCVIRDSTARVVRNVNLYLTIHKGGG